MGDVVNSVVGNVTTVSSNASTEFTLSNDGKTLSARFRYDKEISFHGIPAPGVSSFRTGGAGWLRLPDGVLVAAIIVTWAQGADRASIVAFRFGLLWLLGLFFVACMHTSTHIHAYIHTLTLIFFSTH